MASLQSASTSPTLIQVGPGMLWSNVSKPADGDILLVSGNVSGATDQRVYGPVLYTISGTFMGSTIGESNISYNTSFVDILIESSTAKVEKVLNTEEARCTFNVAELTAENLRDTLPGSYWNQPVATLTTGTDPLMPQQVQHRIKVGGLRLVAPQCVAFISPNRRIGLVGTGPHSYTFVGYNSVSTEGFDAPFSRGRETVWRVSFEMISDTSRTIGDQLFQFTVRQAT
jgi:hypothetical protein